MCDMRYVVVGGKFKFKFAKIHFDTLFVAFNYSKMEMEKKHDRKRARAEIEWMSE